MDFLILFMVIAFISLIIWAIQAIRQKKTTPWVIAFLICLGLGGLGSIASEPPAPKHDKITAYVISQDFVSKRLKSPVSAKFPSFSEEYVCYLGEKRYQVSAYVDSQNSFGAMIRTQFNCVVKYVGNSDWVLERLEI